MRILVFTTAYDPLIGGAELALQNIAERLPQYEFDIITKRHKRDLPKFEQKGNIRIHRVGFGHYLDKHFYILLLLAPYKAWQLMSNNKYDSAWAVMANQAGLAALFVNKLFKLPYLLTLQEGDSEKWVRIRARLFSVFYKAIYRQAAAIQAISDFLKQRSINFDAPAPKVVVPNGIDTQKFAPISPYEKSQIRKEIGVPEGKTVVVTTSRLVEKNAVDVLIRAVARIAEQTRNLTLRHAQGLQRGTDAETPSPSEERAGERLLNREVYLLIAGDGPLRPDLERLTDKLGIRDKVKFAGEISYENLQKYVQAGDIFVRASRSEGLGTSFLEAMACGLPVIGTEVGGIPDILIPADLVTSDVTRPSDVENPNGLFCKVDDPDDLAKQIKRLINDRSLYEKLAGEAYAFAQKYDWENIAKRMKPVFDMAASPKKRIMIATGIFPPDIGGPATYVEKIAGELSERDYGVSVVTYSDHSVIASGAKQSQEIAASPAGSVRQAPRDDKFKVHRVRRNRNKLPHYLQYFWTIFRLAPYYDLIYIQDPVSAGLPTMIACKLRFKKYVLKIVGDYAWEQGRARFGVKEMLDEFKPEKYGRQVRFLRQIEKMVAESAKLIITPSKYLKERVLTWDIDTEISVIYNGVEIKKHISKNKARKNLDLDGTVILTVARLVQWKGIDTLINLVPQLQAKFADLNLVIVGGGPDYDLLKDIISEKNLNDKVRMTGSIEHDEVLEYISAADVVVLNSGYEGLPHVLAESLMLKTPVLASRIGGNPEIVIDKETGLLFSYNESEEIKQAVDEILTNRTLREKLVENGYKYVEEKFNFKTMFSETINILERV